MNILDVARDKVLGNGEGLNQDEVLAALQVSDDELPELLQLAHDVRVKYCGVDVSLEGIISLKTGGCPEDCHFCSQSGLFESPVRAVTLNGAPPSRTTAAEPGCQPRVRSIRSSVRTVGVR